MCLCLCLCLYLDEGDGGPNGKDVELDSSGGEQRVEYGVRVRGNAYENYQRQALLLERSLQGHIFWIAPAHTRTHTRP